MVNTPGKKAAKRPWKIINDKNGKLGATKKAGVTKRGKRGDAW